MIIPMTDIERKLTEDHLSIVAKVIQTLTCGCRYVSYDERQDLLQIGNLALCKAAMNYDGNRPFETYAKVVIRNAIYDYWRSLQKERTYTCSMDAIADNETDTSYQQLLADTSSLQNLEQEHNLRSIYEYLQTLQNVNCTTIKKGIQALLLQQNGYTSQEISKHYGVPASHVRAWKSKARKYLQQDATLYTLLS
ncbi:sigma-70 family RNA polymerase sigma factor [[Clostridium] scindens]|uniref:Sigma-70 family RNA polymerase sigma factor n=1 Tax=Clostridium scindens (strain JCM 10418 / VPI 12708) TaxID=29347 RepID=A0A844F7U9_CLOSV|nr:sigma-70 family RNA polymerase sigma factor [[Clostridium] scindens]MSS41763.1 sigma-70 family RNA polymerase sigma factor [[Clostridium] scindens]WPB23631.1 RNA polymerase sigma factor SigI [[Clostridium] scindens]